MARRKLHKARNREGRKVRSMGAPSYYAMIYKRRRRAAGKPDGGGVLGELAKQIQERAGA